MKQFFTLAEYIEEKGLDVDIHHPKATRMIARHLQKMGYVKIRKNLIWVWAHKSQVKGRDLDRLASRLAKIEEKLK